MGRNAAIVAVGQTDHVSRRLDVSIPEMVREAVDRCLGSKDLNPAQVDAVVVGNMELFEGINFPELWMASAIGAAGKPLFKLNNGGTVRGQRRRRGGSPRGFRDSTTWCWVSVTRSSPEGETQSAITTVGDPAWERSVMAGAIGNFGVMASTYVAESGVTAEQAAKVTVKARRNACLNPHAHLQSPDITVEDVLASRMLAAPLRLLDMCPSSDGACAVVMAAPRPRP